MKLRFVRIKISFTYYDILSIINYYQNIENILWCHFDWTGSGPYLSLSYCNSWKPNKKYSNTNTELQKYRNTKYRNAKYHRTGSTPSPSLLAVLCNSCKEQLSPQLSRFSLSSSQSCSQHPQLAKKYFVAAACLYKFRDWSYAAGLARAVCKKPFSCHAAQAEGRHTMSTMYRKCSGFSFLHWLQGNTFSSCQPEQPAFCSSCTEKQTASNQLPLASAVSQINWFQAQCETLILVASCNKSCILCHSSCCFGTTRQFLQQLQILQLEAAAIVALSCFYNKSVPSWP